MTRELLIISTLLELADTMVVDHDIVDFLYLLCDRAVEVADADAAGVLLMAKDGSLEVATASSHEMRRLEQHEVTLGQGPCVDAHRSGRRVDHHELAQADHWPEFIGMAVEIGFHSVHARPLRLRDQTIGALNVYRRSPGPFDEETAAVLGGLADMASIGIAHERAQSDAEKQISNLQGVLDKRAVVDQAMAVLADRLDVDHGDAFIWLRSYARANNMRLREVAQRFLDGELATSALAPG